MPFGRVDVIDTAPDDLDVTVGSRLAQTMPGSWFRDLAQRLRERATLRSSSPPPNGRVSTGSTPDRCGCVPSGRWTRPSLSGQCE